jgi:YVTN family beta-propeller protein
VALAGLLLPAAVANPAAAAVTAATATCPSGQVFSSAAINLGNDSNPLNVAVNSVTDRIYVNLGNDDDIQVINGHTNAKIGTIPVGGAPTVDDKTDLIYAASGPTSLAVINGHTDRVVHTIKFPGVSSIGAVVADPVNGLVYVVLPDSDAVAVIRASTNKVVTRIAMGSQPEALTVDARTHRVYVVVGDGTDAWVTVVNQSTNKVITTVPMSRFIDRISVDTWTDQIYVTVDSDGAMWVLNGRTNAVSGPVQFGGNDRRAGPTVDPNLDTVFVVGDDTTMDGVCGHTNAIATTSFTSDLGEISSVGVDAATQQVYAVDEYDWILYVYDFSSFPH